MSDGMQKEAPTMQATWNVAEAGWQPASRALGR